MSRLARAAAQAMRIGGEGTGMKKSAGAVGGIMRGENLFASPGSPPAAAPRRSGPWPGRECRARHRPARRRTGCRCGQSRSALHRRSTSVPCFSQIRFHARREFPAHRSACRPRPAAAARQSGRRRRAPAFPAPPTFGAVALRKRQPLHFEQQRLISGIENAARACRHRADGVAMIGMFQRDDAVARFAAPSSRGRARQ